MAAAAHGEREATSGRPVRRPVGPLRGRPVVRPAANGFGLGSLLGIGLLIVAVLVGIRLIGSLFGGGRGAYGPGPGGPGMGPGYGGGPGYGAGYGGRGGGGFFSSILGGHRRSHGGQLALRPVLRADITAAATTPIRPAPPRTRPRPAMAMRGGDWAAAAPKAATGAAAMPVAAAVAAATGAAAAAATGAAAVAVTGAVAAVEAMEEAGSPLVITTLTELRAAAGRQLPRPGFAPCRPSFAMTGHSANINLCQICLL